MRSDLDPSGEVAARTPDVGLLLDELRALGVRLTVEGDRLKVSAPEGCLTDELRAKIAIHKAELLRLLSSERPEVANRTATPFSTEELVRREFPMTTAQRRLWFLDRLLPGNPAYNLGVEYPFEGSVDTVLLERAVNEVVRHQAALRTVFGERDGEPRQIVLPYEPVPVGWIDLTERPADRRNAEYEEFKARDAAVPFDLVRGPVFRATLVKRGPTSYALLVCVHHIACDGWSLGILAQDFGTAYQSLAVAGAKSLAPLALTYGEYAVEESRAASDMLREHHLAYWRRKLLAAPPTHSLSTDRARPVRQTFNGAAFRFAFSPQLSDGLRALAVRENATLYMVLLAAFKVLLYRHGGDPDVVVGTPVTNRNRPELESLVGLFVSTIATRDVIDGDAGAAALIRGIRETVLEAQEHQGLPFEALIEDLHPARSQSWSPVFQIVFALQNTPGVQAFSVTNAAAMYDLSLFMWGDSAAITGTFEYNVDLFDLSTVERMARHLEAIAAAMVAMPDTPLSSLPLGGSEDRLAMLSAFNPPATAYPKEATIPRLFAEIVAARPDAVAIESSAPDRRGHSTLLTYAQLDRLSDRISRRLRDAGVRQQTLVGVFLPRSILAVASILAILKLRAVYVPLDPADPPLRTAEIIRDSRLGVLVAPLGASNRMPEVQVGWVELDELLEAPEAEAITRLDEPTGQADDLAYVMFTSGTTGKPKGVAVAHRNIVRLVKDTNYVTLGPDLRILLLAPLAFDASTFEMWGALLNGGRLFVMSDRVPTTRAIAEALERHAITTLWLSAGYFHAMVDHELAALAAVRQVLAGGDVLSAQHVQRLLDAKKDGVVINGYGPTENTTFTCCHVMSPGERVGPSVLIGKPIANSRVYILDRAGEPVPAGVVGELHAAGDGVARGYLGDEESTLRKFVPDPLGAARGERMYRTGDMARRRADGTIEFLGRVDRQVKVRGFRIELDEIEAALRSTSQVADAAVTATRDQGGTNVITAYVAPHPGGGIDQVLVRQQLARTLPDYMMPGAFVVLEKLPLTVNGKVDRAALPRPTSQLVAAIVEPRTALETQLLAIWQSVLGHTGFGIQDNFFDLGGHSLLALRLFAQIESVFGRRMPISALFEAPTIEQLARALGDAGLAVKWDSLVAIRTGGAKPPVFLVPGIGGNVLCYADLARLMEADRPIYGLQSIGLDGKSEPLESIEEMAERYIADIRSAQPSGPYLLAGTCFGGAVALEMARRLRAAGEVVAFLGLLETWPPSESPPVGGMLLRSSHVVRYLVNGVRRYVRALTSSGSHSKAEVLRRGILVMLEMLARRDVYRGEAAAFYSDRVSTANHRAFLRYRLRPYEGDAFLVIASSRPVAPGTDPRLALGALCAGGFEAVSIPARDSGTLLQNPHVERLARALGDRLNRIPTHVEPEEGARTKGAADVVSR